MAHALRTRLPRLRLLGATQLAGAAYGGVAPADVDRLGYSNVYETRLDTAGTIYFACQVGAHCASAQKIAVAVA